MKKMWKVEYKDMDNGFEFEDVFDDMVKLQKELVYLAGAYDEIRVTKVSAE